MLKNDRLLKALRRQAVDQTPVWFMRQAGRYLPEYRQTRNQAGSFLKLCQTPELACEVTLQPIQRFDLDAAIIFSDILIIPDALGMGLAFKEGEGPYFEKSLQTVSDVQQLKLPAIKEKLHYLFEAIRLVVRELGAKIPLIGFCGSPWTMATYMIEGGVSKQFSKIKKWLYAEPVTLHELLKLLTQAVIDCLIEQIAAGVQVVMIFDTWGGVLTTREYEQFSLSYMGAIVTAIKKQCSEIPIILFTKNGSQWLEKIAQTQCDGVGIDWTIDLSSARQRIGHQVALQGNMDPAILYASSKRIQQEVHSILNCYRGQPGHIFNLGHGILPDVLPNQVQAMIDAVRGYKEE